MNPGRWNRDSFLLGLFSGLLSLIVFYFLLNVIRLALVDYLENPYLMKPPILQLIVILINVIIFRWIMINLGREQTGKGFLFIIVLLALAYFYYFFKISGR